MEQSVRVRVKKSGLSSGLGRLSRDHRYFSVCFPVSQENGLCCPRIPSSYFGLFLLNLSAWLVGIKSFHPFLSIPSWSVYFFKKISEKQYFAKEFNFDLVQHLHNWDTASQAAVSWPSEPSILLIVPFLQCTAGHLTFYHLICTPTILVKKTVIRLLDIWGKGCSERRSFPGTVC